LDLVTPSAPDAGVVLEQGHGALLEVVEIEGLGFFLRCRIVTAGELE